MRGAQEREFEYQGHWLVKFPHSKNWYIAWYDGVHRQRRTRTTRTADFQEAIDRLIDHVRSLERPLTIVARAPNQVSIAEIFEWYENARAKNKEGKTQIRIHRDYWLSFFGVSALISDISVFSQEKFSNRLAKAGKSIGYTQRIFSTMRAAVRYALRHDIISAGPTIIHVETKDDREAAPPMGRDLKIEEIAAVLDSVPDDRYEHLWRFLVLMLLTGARNSTILDLKYSYFDIDARRANLNPPGRTQTKKRRPHIPICDVLASSLTAWRASSGLDSASVDDAWIVTWGGKLTCAPFCPPF